MYGLSILASNAANNVLGITSLAALQDIVIWGFTLGAIFQIVLWVGALLVAFKYLGDVIINCIEIYSHFKHKGSKDDSRPDSITGDSSNTR